MSIVMWKGSKSCRNENAVYYECNTIDILCNED